MHGEAKEEREKMCVLTMASYGALRHPAGCMRSAWSNNIEVSAYLWIVPVTEWMYILRHIYGQHRE